MVKMKLVFLSLVMAVFAASVYAQKAGDFNVVLTNDGKGVIITDYTGSVLDVKIPSEIEGLPVREIRALRVSKIRSLVIPDTVTTIGERAFCLIERGVTYIGGITSTDLVSVSIPDSVTSIGAMAFAANSKLGSVVLPDNIKTIPDYCFNACESLASVILPSNLTSIGATAFAGCSSLKSIDLPSSVVKVEAGAFLGCSSLTSIKFPASITEIGENAFKNTAIVSVTIPPNVTQLPVGAFAGCEKLTSVTFSDKIQTISTTAFSGCSQLTSITIPDSITTLYGSTASPFPTQKLNLATQARLRNITWHPSIYYLYNAGVAALNPTNDRSAPPQRATRTTRGIGSTSAEQAQDPAEKVRNDTEQALSYFNQQLQLTPDHADTYAQRSVIYQLRGDNDKARADIEKTLQLDPNNKVAKETMTKIERGEAQLRSQADLERVRTRNRGWATTLNSLEKDLNTLQPLKNLNANQYTTFENIYRRYVNLAVEVRNTHDWYTAFNETERLLKAIYAKLSKKQKESFDKASLSGNSLVIYGENTQGILRPGFMPSDLRY
jgi:hypothetical protein